MSSDTSKQSLLLVDDDEVFRTRMARAFVDHAGRLHQRIAEQADVVVFMTAGIGQRLK